MTRLDGLRAAHCPITTCTRASDLPRNVVRRTCRSAGVTGRHHPGRSHIACNQRARPRRPDPGRQTSSPNFMSKNRPRPRWDAGLRPMARAFTHTQYIRLPGKCNIYFHKYQPGCLPAFCLPQASQRDSGLQSRHRGIARLKTVPPRVSVPVNSPTPKVVASSPPPPAP